jgi:hypothetical protein
MLLALRAIGTAEILKECGTFFARKKGTALPCTLDSP